MSEETKISGNVCNTLLITVDEVAELLGIARRTVQRMDSAGKLPSPLRLGLSGKCIRWNKAELESWIAAGCPPRVKWIELIKPKNAALIAQYKNPNSCNLN